ncbi:hypothetical protein CAMGR0001_2657 [Campylobacter gracilis RM3268]|uniref:Uncharacterized protein n=1 Tax=Campylobacter gracilis RM3268 TaxID=553220 RepID=C8PF16_9BACT|nr:hypothetical protein CAMGR0001_2657 [Campylobacter gracilis RM3268]
MFKFRASRSFVTLFKFTSDQNDNDQSFHFARRHGRRLLNLALYLKRPHRLKFYRTVKFYLRHLEFYPRQHDSNFLNLQPRG